MKNKIALVTGSTDGIGRQTALDLVRLGATVLIHGRNAERCREVRDSIARETGAADTAEFTADLLSFEHIHQLAEDIRNRFDRIDVLINNAGVYENTRRLSTDGYETTFAVNHLAPFVLTGLLMDLIRHSAAGRIVNVSSMIHADHIDFSNLQGENDFSGSTAYSLSKLCNILFTYELAERLSTTAVTANCLHPGVIETKLLRAAWSGGRPVSEGSGTSVYLAASPDVSGVSGKYFVNRKPSRSADVSYDPETRKRLWQLSEEMTGVTYSS
jgi:NAD(P)-dependent dehydrogenase (short-subunit alcohol dehydrogenase family)